MEEDGWKVAELLDLKGHLGCPGELAEPCLHLIIHLSLHPSHGFRFTAPKGEGRAGCRMNPPFVGGWHPQPITVVENKAVGVTESNQAPVDVDTRGAVTSAVPLLVRFSLVEHEAERLWHP